MSGSKRRVPSYEPMRDAMERVTARFAPNASWLPSPLVVSKVADAASNAARYADSYDGPVPTRADALDALMHMDDARQSIDRDELWLITWAKYAQGASWEEIGAALGYGRADGTGSKQGAQGRYGALRRRYSGTAERYEAEARAAAARAAEQQGDEQQ